MAYEPKAGDGTLFENDTAQGNQPAMTGYVLAHRNIQAGEKVNLAGWRKGGAGGRSPFLSLKMSDMREREQAAPKTQNTPPPDMDDDIPF